MRFKLQFHVGEQRAAAGATAAAPASTTRAPASYGPLSVQLSWLKNFEFAGNYIADSKGYYRQAGFDSVDLIAGGATASVESAVLAKKAFIGCSTSESVVAAVQKGAGIKVIGALLNKDPSCIASLAKKPIRTPRISSGRPSASRRPGRRPGSSSWLSTASPLLP